MDTRATRRVAIVAFPDNPLYPYLFRPIHDELAEHDHRTVLLAERSADAIWNRSSWIARWTGLSPTTTRLSSSYVHVLPELVLRRSHLRP